VSGMAQAQRVPMAGQAVAGMNETVPRLSVAAGRKGFKAELVLSAYLSGHGSMINGNALS
jgi:hypothetical protein